MSEFDSFRSEDGEANTHRGTDRFISRIMPDSKVRVIQRLFASDAFRRIEVQQLCQEINRQGVGTGEEGLEGDPRLDREGSNVILSLMDGAHDEPRMTRSIVRDIHEVILRGEGCLLRVCRDSARFDSIDRRS